MTASPEVHFTRSDMCQRFNVISCPPPPIGDTNELRFPGSEGLRTRVGALGLPPRPFTANAQVLGLSWPFYWTWQAHGSGAGPTCLHARQHVRLLSLSWTIVSQLQGWTGQPLLSTQHSAHSSTQHTAQFTQHPAGGGEERAAHHFLPWQRSVFRSRCSLEPFFFIHVSLVVSIPCRCFRSDRKFH